MASYDFSSVLEFDRNGKSFQYSDTGTNSDIDATLTDGDDLGDTFAVGESVSVKVDGIYVLSGYFGGTYTPGDTTYLWIYDTPDAADATKAFLVSPDDLATTISDLPPGNIDASRDIDDAPFVVCFAEGTLIATPDGERTVESLKIGDLVLTSDGTPVPVKWLGRQTVDTKFRVAERLGLVRIAAGALGDGTPHSDLTVTSDHALLIDGVLCHAGALVDGVAIRRLARSEVAARFSVYHVETEDHAVIYANGATTETYIDNVSRRLFDNFAEFDALYGDVPEMRPLPLPRVLGPRQVPQNVRARLRTGAAA